MNRSGDTSSERVKEVISYRDDLFVWVYLDQADRVIRYEAFVVGYDESGERTTLEFVLEEGVLDNMHEVPLFWQLLQEQRWQSHAGHNGIGTYEFTADGRLITPTPLKYFYSSLDAAQMQAIHDYFEEQENLLKQQRRLRWTRMLRALGYDVIPSL